MRQSLLNYFKTASDNCNETRTGFVVSLDTNFGSVILDADFDSNTFKVTSSVDEDQYCAMFMIDEEEINESELEDWNSSETFNEIKKALIKCQDIVEAYNSESDGSIEDRDYEFFENAIKLFKDGEK